MQQMRTQDCSMGRAVVVVAMSKLLEDPKAATTLVTCKAICLHGLGTYIARVGRMLGRK